MTNEKLLTAEIMKTSLNRLDQLVGELPSKKNNTITAPSVQLIVGGGGAMILAHHFPLATTDIDAIPKGIEIAELSPLVLQISLELILPSDWLNPYFSTFAICLPASFKDRLCTVFDGKHIQAFALGKEDMLIMKCFAHRNKDIGHAKALIKNGADVLFVEDHILRLKEKSFKGSNAALDFLDEIREDL